MWFASDIPAGPLDRGDYNLLRSNYPSVFGVLSVLILQGAPGWLYRGDLAVGLYQLPDPDDIGWFGSNGFRRMTETVCIENGKEGSWHCRTNEKQVTTT